MAFMVLYLQELLFSSPSTRGSVELNAGAEIRASPW